MNAIMSRALVVLLACTLLPTEALAKKWTEEKRHEIEAPTLEGGAGLFRTWSATAGNPWDVRVGIHFEYFTHKEFIVANGANCGDLCPNERNTRFQGAVTAGFTPWKYLEIYAALFSTSNLNERNHLEPTQEPAVQMALGDWLLGVKGFYPVIPALSIGGTVGVKFMNSYGDLNVDAAGTNVFLALAMSLDVAKLAPKVPLRFHLNLGWIYDGSHNLLGEDPEDYTPDATGGSEKRHAFLVQQFALGLNVDRFRLSFGVDARLPYLGGLFNPIAEIQMDVATGSSNPVIETWPEFTTADDSYNVDGRVASRLALGVRFRPVAGLVIDTGVDVALTHFGFAMGPPLPPWNFFIQAAYSFSTVAKAVPKPVVKIVEKEVTKVVQPEPTTGKVAGTVKDAKSGMPISTALITFPGMGLTDLATAEDGSFTSCQVNTGEIPVEVRHPDYEPWQGKAQVEAGKTASLSVLLKKKAPEVGVLVGTMTSKKQGKPLSGTVEVEGTEKQKTAVGEDGTFSMKLKPGAYKVKASSDGHFSRYDAVVMKAGAKEALEFKLTARPKRARVIVTKRKIRIKRKIHFAYAKATIRPDSLQILDEVAAVLNEHPAIKKVRIEGHTDRRGGYRVNLRLSQKRAESVRDYLVSQGVDPDRLLAKGYGYKRPLVPELTPRHRAINRRVEFRILKRER